MADSQDTPDMDLPQTFFDPHPGFAGAAIPIPGAIKKVADALNGQTLPLKEALARLRAVGIGEIGVVAKYAFITLRLYSGPNQPEHFFRVIRYRRPRPI